MSTPLEQQLQRIRPYLSHTLDRYDYRKSPVRFSSLYRTLQLHALREGGGRVSFCMNAVSSHATVAVCEYPLALAFGIAMRIALSTCPDCTVQIHAEEHFNGIALIMSVKTTAPSKMAHIVEEYREFLFDTSSPAHFEAVYAREKGLIFYQLNLPYFDAENFELFTEKVATSMALLGLSDAACIISMQ